MVDTVSMREIIYHCFSYVEYFINVLYAMKVEMKLNYVLLKRAWRLTSAMSL